MSDDLQPGTIEYVERFLRDEHGGYWEFLSSSTMLAGWAAAREHGIFDVAASDAIATAAAKHVWERIAETLVPPAETSHSPGETQ